MLSLFSIAFTLVFAAAPQPPAQVYAHNQIGLKLDSFRIVRDHGERLAEVRIVVENQTDDDLELGKWNLEGSLVSGLRLWRVNTDETYRIVPLYLPPGPIFSIPKVTVKRNTVETVSFTLAIGTIERRRCAESEWSKPCELPADAVFCVDLRMGFEPIIEGKSPRPLFAESVNKLWYQSK
ncbi:MAG: hypothetical protein IT450_04590 [Phycisphaerales bacterium]|nr:hypothetical protein [Phycisphaerales bacterium]